MGLAVSFWRCGVHSSTAVEFLGSWGVDLQFPVACCKNSWCPRGPDLRKIFYNEMKSSGSLMTKTFQAKATKTPQGKRALFEKTKAVAFQKTIAAMEKHLGKSCWQLTGQGEADFTAGHLRVQGGGRPSGRAVKSIWAKASSMAHRRLASSQRPSVGAHLRSLRAKSKL